MADKARIGAGTEFWMADAAGPGANFVRCCDMRTYQEDSTVPEVDATTFCDDATAYVPGLAEGDTITAEINLRPDHPFQSGATGLRKMIRDKEQREVILRPAGSTLMYRRKIQVTSLGTSIPGPNELMSTSVTFRASGAPIEETYADPLTLTPTDYS